MLPLVEIDIDPVIVQLGPLTLRWYSLMIMLGVLAGVWCAGQLAERRGLVADDVYSAAFWIVGAGLIGARLAHVADRWDYYAAVPMRILALYEGGLAIWGGVLAGGLATIIYANRARLPWWRLADAVAHGALLGLVIGRIGSLINGDVAGLPTRDWGIAYTNPHALLPRADYFNTPTQPYPLYEMALLLVLFWVLFRVARRARFDGEVFIWALGGYSLIRFVLAFTREAPVMVAGLQQAQVLGLTMLLVSAYLYLYRRSVRPARTRTRAVVTGPAPAVAGEGVEAIGSEKSAETQVTAAGA